MRTGFTFYGKLRKRCVGKRIKDGFTGFLVCYNEQYIIISKPPIIRLNMSEMTTIQVKQSTKDALERMKTCKSETYNDIIERLIEDVQELNEETKKEIELARKAIEEGRCVTHEKLKEELGF